MSGHQLNIKSFIFYSFAVRSKHVKLIDGSPKKKKEKKKKKRRKKKRVKKMMQKNETILHLRCKTFLARENEEDRQLQS